MRGSISYRPSMARLQGFVVVQFHHGQPEIGILVQGEGFETPHFRARAWQPPESWRSRLPSAAWAPLERMDHRDHFRNATRLEISANLVLNPH